MDHPHRTTGKCLGYLVPEFPSQTHAFFWREVRAMREAGATVHSLSTRRPPTELCRHEFAELARAETTYLFPPGLVSLGTLLGRPWRTFASVRYLLGLSQSSWRKRLRYLGLIPCAATLVRHARRNGYGHVHIHSCADAAHLGALAHILGGLTYSLTLHGDLPVYGVDHGRKMQRAAFVSCVTRPLADQVRNTVGLPSNRVTVLWMGVETENFVDLPVRESVAGRLHLVTVARLNRMKGHRYALEAMRAAIDAGLDLHYTIAGEGDTKAEIEADVARLRLEGRVTLPGTLGEGEVRNLLARADAFVLPSVGQGEAAPVSVMEAMAAGLPVVSSIIGGTPDMITDGADGLLVPQADVAGLTAAFVRLANDATLRRRLGSAARERAIHQFDSRTLARRLLENIFGDSRDGN